jgi:tetrahydromethanopterin S-methyltransferase subunit B
VDIFKKKEDSLILGLETKILVSYLEIYNEEMKDLLDPRKKQLKIFSTSEGVIVQNLSKVYCESLEDVMKLL